MAGQAAPGVTFVPTPALDAVETGRLIRARRLELGLTQAQLVERTGLSSQSYLSSFEKGRYHIGRSEHFAAVARELRLSHEEVRQINPALFVDLADDPRPHAQDGVVRLLGDGLAELPVYGLAAAHADGNMATERPVGVARVPARYARGEMHAYAVLGDSMDDGTRAGIRDGDHIVCNHADKDLCEGKIYVVSVPGNGILLKRVRRYADGELYLASDNPGYRDLSPENARIIGRVVWIDPQGYAP